MTNILLPTRRIFLAGFGAATFIGPHIARAAQPAKKPKLLLVILRGGLDGLGAVPKLDEPHIDAHRGALVDRDANPIGNGFALHSALKTFHAWYQSGEASVVHAVAGPWRYRSHFRAQDLLETGGIDAASSDGWLNRTLQIDPSLSAVSIGTGQSIILSGPAQASSWSPSNMQEASDDTIGRLMSLYEDDPVLGTALMSALETDEIAGDMGNLKKVRGDGGLAATFAAAARLLVAKDGPDIAVASVNGWDTHTNQKSALNRRLGFLDKGLESARDALGDAWDNTAIVCVTEFGRTVRINGSKGSDHGTAGAAFLAGGALKGGRVWGDWPGLSSSQLYENRDLAPANDMTSMFKGVLSALYGFGTDDLNKVFPETRAMVPMRFA